jgi:hypothetical protein
MDLTKLSDTYHVLKAKGAKALESYDLDDLRVMDDELEPGVQAVISGESESIVAFLFSKGTFTEEKAQEWIEAAEKDGVNLSLGFVLKVAPAHALAAELGDISFEEIYRLLAEALDSEGLTMPDGSYRWPWLVATYPEYCVIEVGARNYRLEYQIDDMGEVTFGTLQEVRMNWVPVEVAAARGTAFGALKSHTTATTDVAWDGAGNKKRARSGEDEAYYRKIFAWRDPDGEPDVKASYKLPHHEVDADGEPGAANTNGCSAAIAVLNGGRGGSSIPDADRQSVWNHLSKHIKDAGLEAPELKVSTSATVPASQRPHRFILELHSPPAGFQVAGGEDLIWKEIFRVSSTFRADGSILKVEQPMVDALSSAFEAKVVDKVPITANTHYEGENGIVPAKDTNGEVAMLVQEDGSLFGGLRIVDEDIRAKIDQNLIASCSIYAWPNYVDRRDGKVWPWVLAHLLLTNYPQLPDMKPFGEKPASLAASAWAGAMPLTYVEENRIMPENASTTQPAGAATLSAEDAALLEQAKKLKAEGLSFDTLKTQRDALKAQARELEVKSIVAALEGKQARDGVTAIEGFRHYPAVIAAAERVLRGQGIGFSVDVSQEGKAAVDEVVISILNAIPQEGRIALTVQTRPDRSDAGMQAPPAHQHRTTPLTPEQAEQVSDEAIEQFVAQIT